MITTALRAPLIALALAAVGAPAHAQFNPLSGITSAVEAAAEDRSSGDIATDLKLKTSIVSSLTDKLGKEGALVGVDVYEQDVMLTGTISTAALKTQAAEVTKALAGVKKIYNELLLDSDLAKDPKKGTVAGAVDDTVIEKKIEAQFATTKGINHTNWRWRSVKGHVFLFGRALSAEENASATKVAKSVAKVISVVDRAKVVPKTKK
jgi:hyperosmotically inducible protein